MPVVTQLTPMMAQYRRIKTQLPRETLLLFRLGDFYELFFDDAVAGAQLLNVALTKRGEIPMCGIPYHAASTYIGRILKAGRKVALCDQVEEAQPGRLVKREITQILSPGTHFDEKMLVAERHNFVAAVYHQETVFGLAAVDLTTGEFRATEIAGEPALRSELQRLRPAEVIAPGESSLPGLLSEIQGGVVHGHDDWVFAPETAIFTLRDHFKVQSLDAFGLADRGAAIGAAGALLQYLSQFLRRDVSHLTALHFYQLGEFLILDATTLRHLEVLEPMSDRAGSSATLFDVLNRTITPMGARRLRDWISQPLAAVTPILRRQAAIAAWQSDPVRLEQFRQKLAEVRDLERTVTRLSSGSGNGRDLQSVRQALEQIPALRELLLQVCQETQTRLRDEIFPAADSATSGSPSASASASATDLIGELEQQLCQLPDVIALVARAIADEPPISVKEGGVIRDGFDPALDELRAATRDGKDWLARLQQSEIERTGISTLKVRFNSVFGYYIEVTKSHLEKVPAHYTRKQTVANGERFITPELKEMESKILGAEERSLRLEYDLFLRVRESVIGHLTAIQQTARALAQLDVLGALAMTARLGNYCRPEVGAEGKLEIREGRHPVLDQAIAEERFVPNDTELNLEQQQIALITGPNMAGKSTYIRQVGLIALLAHTGSFVPAARARVDLMDRIFTRIGAHDDLSRGQSTFMVEMSETANILHHATPHSLIILDEIGRGTSTFDGLSLAWSIVEYIHNGIGAKTLFATHYHELTELATRLRRLRNYNVAVREWNEQIIFLRKIVAGGTDKSYGIQVARLAGVPKDVLSRAKEILRNLEEAELSGAGTGAGRSSNRRSGDRERLKQLPPPPQMDLFA
jgi:DNA mismatch repair protein MutS